MHLRAYTRSYIDQFTFTRPEEVKLGETVQTVSNPENWKEELLTSTAKFVLLGLPEDIGVKANLGREGTRSAWQTAFQSLMNVQSNEWLEGDQLLVLGHIDFTDLLDKADQLNIYNTADLQSMRVLVEQVDERVCEVVKVIAQAGKIPVCIGGGHNNCYPIIKAIAEANGNPINAINLDAHADFRILEGRHSGNGFSYAFENGYLKKYYVIGLHTNYNSQTTINRLRSSRNIGFSWFQDIFIQQQKTFNTVIDEAVEFSEGSPCGLELDLDSVANMPSSAQSPSGITAEQARLYLSRVAERTNITYLHLPEGAPSLAPPHDNSVPKLIAYLVTDFIKAAKK
ncbi:formimidoylglutamase [Solitalea koreensis]|uniref:Formiminoglutamase n=1 Tax=Solitalea koreensis TaxID=543615 RepID=A0A521B040_9SPHI|nr:formimidoylglutamase [Solitalea koreensis]SMO40405.1 formiminoglutamase [Solitalea koreensis]